MSAPTHEHTSLDLSTAYGEVRSAYDNVEKWAATQKAEFNLSFWAMSPKVRSEPKGAVLIIAPFNGPVIMLMSPLVSNMALRRELSAHVYEIDRCDCWRERCRHETL